MKRIKMIETVKHFLEACFEQECTVHREYRKEQNLDAYNAAFEKLNAFTINTDPDIPSKIGFGLSRESAWHDEEFFEELEFLPEINPRHLYKISEYLIEGQKHWLCYTSQANPGKGSTKLLSHCLVVREIEGELKISTELIPDYNTGKWKKVGGIDLDYDSLGIPNQVERFVSPENDAWSLAEYNKNS